MVKRESTSTVEMERDRVEGTCKGDDIPKLYVVTICFSRTKKMENPRLSSTHRLKDFTPILEQGCSLFSSKIKGAGKVLSIAINEESGENILKEIAISLQFDKVPILGVKKKQKSSKDREQVLAQHSPGPQPGSGMEPRNSPL